MPKAELKADPAPKPQSLIVEDTFVWNSRRSGAEVRIPLDFDWDLMEDFMDAEARGEDSMALMRDLLGKLIPGGIRGKGLGTYEVQAMFAAWQEAGRKHMGAAYPES
jgi:hypothetical protein